MKKLKTKHNALWTESFILLVHIAYSVQLCLVCWHLSCTRSCLFIAYATELENSVFTLAWASCTGMSFHFLSIIINRWKNSYIKFFVSEWFLYALDMGGDCAAAQKGKKGKKKRVLRVGAVGQSYEMKFGCFQMKHDQAGRLSFQNSIHLNGAKIAFWKSIHLNRKKDRTERVYLFKRRIQTLFGHRMGVEVDLWSISWHLQRKKH